jgi:hypothetical protein
MLRENAVQQLGMCDGTDGTLVAGASTTLKLDWDRLDSIFFTEGIKFLLLRCHFGVNSVGDLR